MLDHRVYRAAFVPALVALLVVAFSLGDRPGARTTRIAPDAFAPERAYGTEATSGSLLALAARFPARRPGSAADRELAEVVERSFETGGERGERGFVEPGEVRRITVDGETIGGRVPLEAVVAVREGLSSHSIVVVAHRDAYGAPAVAELSGTAALLELARVFAEGDLPRTLVLASVSGGSGGFDGARAVAERLEGEVDAVLVLGDLASEHAGRPFVIPWSAGAAPAPHGLRRTVETALRTETGSDAGGARLPAQWARRAFALTLSEQGVLGAAGLPAVLVSATGERGPAPGDRTSEERFTTFGRGVVRAVRALEDARLAKEAEVDRPLFAEEGGVVTVRRLLPDWAVRLLAAALLLPVLLAAADGFFRVRRRGLPMARWLGWAAAGALPFVLAWGAMRLADVTGAVRVLPQPTVPEALPLETAGSVALGAVALVVVLGWFALRPLALRALGVRGDPAAGGGAAAAGLLLALLVAGVWVLNPYAAFVLLPAAHLWLLVSAPETRWHGTRAALAFAAGLALPALVGVLLAHGLDLTPIDALWVGFQAFAGPGLGVLGPLALAAFAGLGGCVLTILRGRRRAMTQAPDEPIVTRGPRSYAGPGSLGGTESALRR